MRMSFFPVCMGLSLVLTALPSCEKTSHSTLPKVSQYDESVNSMWLVGWHSSDLVQLSANMQDRILLAKLTETDNCVPDAGDAEEHKCEKKLEILYSEDCRVRGMYEMKDAPPVSDMENIATLADIYARLPLGAVELGGAFETNKEWFLKYTQVGVRRANESRILRTSLPSECEATHFVSQIIVGAYRLSDSSSTSGGGGIRVRKIKFGSDAEKTSEQQRIFGDPDSCMKQPKDALCQYPISVSLEKISAPKTCNPGEVFEDGVCHTECEHGRSFVNGKGCVFKPKGAELVRIEGGDFIKGDNRFESPLPNPEEVITVKTFWMDKTEVTVAQYEECVKARACEIPDSKDKYANWNRPGRQNHPINGVSWDQANTYCRWAQKRLPTEAEWEYAARSGKDNTKPYPWGTSPPDCTRAVYSESNAVYGCGLETTHAVCANRKAGNSQQGLCDLAGNVQEWTATPDCPRTEPGCQNGKWITRGGSFQSFDKHLRNSYRTSTGERFYDSSNGFRCAHDDDKW